MRRAKKDQFEKWMLDLFNLEIKSYSKIMELIPKFKFCKQNDLFFQVKEQMDLLEYGFLYPAYVISFPILENLIFQALIKLIWLKDLDIKSLGFEKIGINNSQKLHEAIDQIFKPKSTNKIYSEEDLLTKLLDKKNNKGRPEFSINIAIRKMNEISCVTSTFKDSLLELIEIGRHPAIHALHHRIGQKNYYSPFNATLYQHLEYCEHKSQGFYPTGTLEDITDFYLIYFIREVRCFILKICTDLDIQFN